MTGGLRSLVDALVYGLAQVSSLVKERMNTRKISTVTLRQRLLMAKPLELSVQLYCFLYIS